MPYSPMLRLPSALAIIHPLPSLLVSGLVLALALVAGGELPAAVLLASGMLGFQVSIGSLNDIVDAEHDRVGGRAKPIPAGFVTRRTAAAIALGGALVGFGVSAVFGLGVLVLGALGYGCGLAYDLAGHRRGWGWLCFAAAFPILLAWTWLAAAGTLPPGWPLLLPLAALAGPTIHLANSLVDLETDEALGLASLAVRLGRGRAWTVLVLLSASVHLLAWATLVAIRPLPPLAVVLAAGGSLVAVVGLLRIRAVDRRGRVAGWLLGALGLAMLAIALGLGLTRAG